MGKQKQMRRWWQPVGKLNQLWRRQHQRRAKMPRWRWAARQPSVEIHRVDFSKMASGRSLWVFEQGARLPCEVTALWGNLVHALRAQCCQPYRAAAIQGGSHTGRQPYRAAAHGEQCQPMAADRKQKGAMSDCAREYLATSL